MGGIILIMILLAHVIIALTSMVFAGIVFFKPTETRIKVSYALVGSTLISGTYLVVTAGSPLLRACLTGLAYLGFVFAATISAQRKLAQVTVRSDREIK